MTDITVIYNSAILRWIGLEGLVLYPYILLATTKEETRPSVYKHEITHVHQVNREGFCGFYYKYFKHICSKIYSNSFSEIFLENEFENEAYKNENRPLSKQELLELNLPVSFPKTDKLYFKSKK